MVIFNKKNIKKKFEEKGMKIGGRGIKRFLEIKEKEIELDIEKIIRRAKLSGKRVVREEDF